MIPSNLSPLTAHLWQSTWCAAAAWLLTLALRRNRAAVRYWIWLAASLKFLLPFSLLVSIGNYAGNNLAWRRPSVAVQQQVSFVVDEISQPFTPIAPTPPHSAIAPTAPNWIPVVLSIVWVCGFVVGVIQWLRWSGQIRVARQSATLLNLSLPIEVRSSPGRLEPGVLGIWRPVLLLPEGITNRLTPQQFDAVVAHELCHVRRRDNLTAALHMVVETIFWFHPLVWWIRTRLVDERERACDEEVLRRGAAPMAYAEGILEVCKHYVESPLVCVAGISGANLRKRIEGIMERPYVNTLSFSRKLTIGVLGMLALVAPIAIGVFSAPASRAQSAKPAVIAPSAPSPVVNTPQPTLVAQAVMPREIGPAPRAQTTAGLPRFTTASIALADPSPTHPVTSSVGPDSIVYQATKFSDLIQQAWPVAWYQVIWPSAWSAGNPPWSVGIQARYDLSATMPAGTTPAQLQLMLQGLFADRLQLAAHWEVRTVPVYALKIAPGGVKFQPSADPSRPQARMNVTPAGVEFKPRFPREPVPGPSGATINQISQLISARLDLRMVNLTGLDGVYDIDLTVPGNPPSPGGLNPGWSNSAFINAIETQLGLTVEKTTLPIQMLVIDNLERVPTTTP